MDQIMRIGLYFVMFGLSFYCLSALDMGKILLPVKNRDTKAQVLLLMLSAALSYWVSEFLLGIMYHVN